MISVSIFKIIEAIDRYVVYKVVKIVIVSVLLGNKYVRLLCCIFTLNVLIYYYHACLYEQIVYDSDNK